MENESNILVSIFCLAYNHKKYIRKALDGFIMQKTNFLYEVIIHDDASSDGTAEIIQEYSNNYKFIKPIFQKENQYSKGVSIGREFMFSNLKGKYVAVCEGDDYWTDENKLQKVVDYMERNKDCSLCCHAYSNVVANNEKFIEEIRTLDEEGDIPIGNLIQYKRPSQLASQVFKREVFVNRPNYCWGVGVGDYPLLLYAATKGTVHYLSDNMAAHRIASDGSWTMRIYNNLQNRKKHFEKIKIFLENFDKNTELMYHKEVLLKIDSIDFNCALIDHNYRQAKKFYSYQESSFKKKILINIGICFPKIAQRIELCWNKTFK